MRLLVALLSLCIVTFSTPSWLSASLLINHDKRDYQLKLQQGAGSVSATIQSGKSISFRCPAFPCEVSLTHNNSSITIRNDRDDVVIRQGKLIRRSTVAKK